MMPWTALYPQPVNPRITRYEAVAIARAECRRRNVPWYEPITVHASWRNWLIWTMSQGRENNVHVAVDRRTGKVRRVVGPRRC
jgi:hypothetical protein